MPVQVLLPNEFAINLQKALSFQSFGGLGRTDMGVWICVQGVWSSSRT